MGMIPNDQLVQVFSERTIGNLEYIEQAERRGEPVHEVTQLINSLLGLIVFPKERDFDRIPETLICELRGWPHIDICGGCETLKQFIRRLRNAVAHCNIELLGSERIEGVRFQNIVHGRVVWQQDIQVCDLRAIAFRLFELLHSDRPVQR